jgi:hypothetical protein
MHELSEEARNRTPVNPNIPHARGVAQEQEKILAENTEAGKLLSLEEIMNPFLDKTGAAFGAMIMTATLVTVLALNAASPSTGEHPVFYVTLPAAFVMLCWDIGFGWIHRHETRSIALKGRQEVEQARINRATQEDDAKAAEDIALSATEKTSGTPTQTQKLTPDHNTGADDEIMVVDLKSDARSSNLGSQSSPGTSSTSPSKDIDEEKQLNQGSPKHSTEVVLEQKHERSSLVSLAGEAYVWSQETFPTVTAVIAHLPFALVPFAFAMFVLVQALVTKGWVAVFAYGWDHWVENTGTVGAISGMGFLSVILCNVSSSLSNANKSGKEIS